MVEEELIFNKSKPIGGPGILRRETVTTISHS
jgi:hypothetical protein